MKGVSTPFHLEVESICGAGIQELSRNWFKAYGHVKTKQTVILIGGCNDLLKLGISNGDKFMENISTFQYKLKVLHPENRLVVSLLPRPPALVWFPKDGPLPTNGYVDKSSLVNQINKNIQLFNNTNGLSKLPTFHLMGIRGGNSTGDAYNVITNNKLQHIWLYWCEYSPESKDTTKPKCLHLEDRHRIVAFNRFVKFASMSLIKMRVQNNPVDHGVL